MNTQIKTIMTTCRDENSIKDLIAKECDKVTTKDSIQPKRTLRTRLNRKKN